MSVYEWGNIQCVSVIAFILFLSGLWRLRDTASAQASAMQYRVTAVQLQQVSTGWMYAFDMSVLDVQAVTSFVVILHTTMELWNDLPITRLVAHIGYYLTPGW